MPMITNAITYHPSYVAFLDVLGFETLVRSNQPADQEKINIYFNSINTEIEKLKRIRSKEDIGFLVISDSVILSVRKSGDVASDREIFCQLCVAIQKIQLQLALKDIWLRGGISSGDAYFDESKSQIVGQAFINAYQLERRIAVYPRVVLDSKLIAELRFTSAEEMISAITENVLFPWSTGSHVANFKKDVALFIDYLAPSFERPSDLETVVKNIQNNIYSNAEHYSKYRWVADYLIASCIPTSKFSGHRGRKKIEEQFNVLLGL
jgi:hypothetical protein